jgi:hypothetical protein
MKLVHTEATAGGRGTHLLPSPPEILGGKKKMEINPILTLKIKSVFYK